MNGLGEIRQMNRAVADIPQTKREQGYRVQRDRVAQVLRRVLATQDGTVAAKRDTVADARKVLTEIFGAGHGAD
jgi:hypothetical protein